MIATRDANCLSDRLRLRWVNAVVTLVLQESNETGLKPVEQAVQIARALEERNLLNFDGPKPQRDIADGADDDPWGF